MRVYLAAQFARREELRRYADELEKIGIYVTARWCYDVSPEAMGADAYDAEFMAARDIIDIETCDWLLLFTNGPETPIYRGGHHFEAGYALGLKKRVITVGPRDNVFHFLAEVDNYPTWDAVFDLMKAVRKSEEEAEGY